MQTTRFSFWFALAAAVAAFAFSRCGSEARAAGATQFTTNNAKMAAPSVPISLGGATAGPGTALSFLRSDAVFAISSPVCAGGQALTSTDGTHLTCVTAGGTVTVNSTLTGNGSGGSPLDIALGHSNTWTGPQTFSMGAFAINPAVIATGAALAGLPVIQVTQNDTSRGALNFTPMASDPTTPSNGDTWVTGSAAKIKVGGTVYTISIPLPVSEANGGTGTTALTCAANQHVTSNGTNYFCSPDAFNAATTSTLVAVGGSSSTAAASSVDNGATWTARTMSAHTWGGVTYDSTLGLFVAVGDQVSATSPDGITWTTFVGAMPSTGWGQIVSNGAGTVVTIGSGTSSRAAFSTNGSTWTASTLSASSGWIGLAWSGSVFAAVDNSSGTVNTSPTGATWTAQTGVAQTSAVAFGNGVFCGLSTSTTNTYTSGPTGVTWTTQTGVLPSAAYTVITYGDKFVAAKSGSNVFATSTDCVTWTSRTGPNSATGSWKSLTWTGSGYVVVGDTSSNPMTGSSPDGITWTMRTMPTAQVWTSVAAKSVVTPTTGSLALTGNISAGGALSGSSLAAGSIGTTSLVGTTTITGAVAASGSNAFDLSGGSGAFKTPTGPVTVGGGAAATTIGASGQTATFLGNIATTGANNPTVALAVGTGSTTVSSTAATARAGWRNANTRNIYRNASVAPPDCAGATLTLTVTQLLDSGIATCGTVQTINFPTWQGASGIVQALPGTPAVGDIIGPFIIVATAANALTLGLGTGGTNGGANLTVAASTTRQWWCRLTNVTASSETATCY